MLQMHLLFFMPRIRTSVIASTDLNKTNFTPPLQLRSRFFSTTGCLLLSLFNSCLVVWTTVFVIHGCVERLYPYFGQKIASPPPIIDHGITHHKSCSSQLTITGRICYSLHDRKFGNETSYILSSQVLFYYIYRLAVIFHFHP
jgi:hypothetical protein